MADSETSMTNQAYDISAICIFAVTSFTFLFPCNKLIPLDRRTIAVLGATLCYITRTFAFPFNKMNVTQAVDFDVLVLLASIMAINHLVVHLKETKDLIVYLQGIIQVSPRKGFWMVSFASFIISPFLTNDGVCLLFVEPILNAFESAFNDSDNVDSEPPLKLQDSTVKKSLLESEDAIYFMLTLACSANIGSALTYTGNPQNMIVSQDAINVMPPYMFTGYMLLPSVVSWLLSKYISSLNSNLHLIFSNILD